jgi:hypothetical protein
MQRKTTESQSNTPPELKRIEHEEENVEEKKGEKKTKKPKSGIDKAMEMLDDYYEGTPPRDPDIDNEGDP